MKRFGEYVSFYQARRWTIVVVVLIFLIPKDREAIIMIGSLIAVAVVFWIKFFIKYNQDKKVFHNGVFIQGKLVKETIKEYPCYQELVIMKAYATYYDEVKQQTMVFRGMELVYNEDLRKARKKQEDIYVLIGYMPQNPRQYILFLKDAIEKVS